MQAQRLVRLPTLFPAKRGMAAPTRPALAPLPWPHAAEHGYAATLLFCAKSTAGALRARVLPRLSALVGRATRDFPEPRADAREARLSTLMAELRAAYGVSAKTARKWAVTMLDAVSKSHATVMGAQYGEVLGLNPMLGNEAWLPGAMSIATTENVALIQSIPETMFTDVERLVGTAALGGQRVEQLAFDILQRFQVAESRAVLIARDQVGKWYGGVQRLRQLDAGIEQYRWSCSLDERVRKSHREREGRTFSWTSPPPDGHPGQPVQCRCVAIPIIPDWEELTGEKEP